MFRIIMEVSEADRAAILRACFLQGGNPRLDGAALAEVCRQWVARMTAAAALGDLAIGRVLERPDGGSEAGHVR